MAHHHAHRRSVGAIASRIVPELCGWEQRSGGSRHSHRRRATSVAPPRTVGAKGRMKIWSTYLPILTSYETLKADDPNIYTLGLANQVLHNSRTGLQKR